jgi:hypothetical protein
MEIKNVYWVSTIEGAFFESNLMREIADITLSLGIQPAPAEPLVFTTIALNLHPELIALGGKKVTFAGNSSIVTDDIIRRTVNGIEGHEDIYALKTVPREINNPVRLKINKLIKDKYGKT